MWRCQLYYQREDAIQCCGEKQCEQIYLDSFPKNNIKCTDVKENVPYRLGSCSYGGCSDWNCPGGIIGDSCYGLKEEITGIKCEYPALEVSCEPAVPNGTGSAECDFFNAHCSEPTESVITHIFKNEDSVNPSECKVKYRRTSRPYTGCNSSNAKEKGQMTTPFLTCDPKKINDDCVVYDSKKVYTEYPSASSGGKWYYEDYCWSKSYK